MAEGWARHLKKDRLESYSAGVEPKGIDPRAVKAMAEVGIDISAQRAKGIETLGDIEFDYVITLCDHAHETCPVFPAKTGLVRVDFDDPPKRAAGMRNEEDAMRHYRRVRDEIKAFVESLPEALTG